MLQMYWQQNKAVINDMMVHVPVAAKSFPAVKSALCLDWKGGRGAVKTL